MFNLEKKMIRMISAFAFAIVATASAAPGFAQDTNHSRVTVRLAGNFDDPSQAGDAYRRLYEAAQEVCWSKGEGPWWRSADDRACENEAMNEAIAKLDQPQLTRLHNLIGVDSNRIAALDARRNSQYSH